MARTHTLISLHEAERRLAQTMSEIEALKATEDYALDFEFFSRLVHLMERYDYSPQEVADMLITREMCTRGHSQGKANGNDLVYFRKLMDMDAPSSLGSRTPNTESAPGEISKQPGNKIQVPL